MLSGLPQISRVVDIAVVWDAAGELVVCGTPVDAGFSVIVSRDTGVDCGAAVVLVLDIAVVWDPAGGLVVCGTPVDKIILQM